MASLSPTSLKRHCRNRNKPFIGYTTDYLQVKGDMVYKRYIHKDGKKIGHYFYKSVRMKDGSVKSVYVGSAAESSGNKHFKNIAFGFLFAALTFIVAFSFSGFNGGKLIGFSIDEGGSVDIDPQVQSVVYDDGSANVIIELKDNSETASAQEHVISALSSESFLILDSETGEGTDVPDFKLKYAYNDVNALAGRITAEGLAKIKNYPNVERVYIDPVLNVLLDESVPLIGASNLTSVQIGGTNITGAGGAVCIIDTGINDEHPSIAGRVVDQYCYCSISGSPCCPNGESQGTNAEDDNGHGTHVAGIIASNDTIYRGVAPGANIVAVKVCNSQGQCTASDIMAAFSKCTEVSAANNIKAISMSIGGTAYTSSCDSVSDSMTTVINNAASAGIFVAIASGNSGYTDKIAWPACVQNAVSVGSVEKTDVVASYSNRNSLLDLMAPGGSSSDPIVSASYTGGFVGRYGTSMATPHAAGAALILQQYNQLYNGNSLSLDALLGLLKVAGKKIYDSSAGVNHSRIDVSSSASLILKVDASANSAEKPGKGKVTFSSSTNLDEISEALRIGDNSILLDSSEWSEFDKAATLEIYGLSFNKTPAVLKDGEICSDCTAGAYSGGNFSFLVTGFSNYSADVNSNLTAWDESDASKSWYSGNSRPGREVRFFADYINRATGTSASNATCIIAFDDSSGSMNFNSSKSAFEFVRNFSEAGIFNYSVECADSQLEALSDSDSIPVNKSSPNVKLKLRGVEKNISALRNSQVSINATILDPLGGQIKLYLNGDILSQNISSLSSTVLFDDYGSNNVTVTYDGSEEYYSVSKTFWINVINDIYLPGWTLNTDGPSQYGQDINLNMTWLDDVEISNAWVENDFGGSTTNYSMTMEGSEFYYTYSGATVGNYSWRSYANDTSGNVNVTEIMVYEVQKAQNNLGLYINGNYNQDVTLTYQKLNITTISSGGSASLFRDGVAISNPFSGYLNVGNYMIKANSSGSDNYTENSTGISFNLQVNKAQSSIELRLKGSRTSATVSSGKSVDLSAKLTNPLNGTVKILVNGASVKEANANASINKTFSSKSNITAVYDGDGNYLLDTESFNVNILSESSSSSASESGGGAVGEAVPSSCVSTWGCTEWSACDGSQQTRSCTDSSGCLVSTSSKPDEAKACTIVNGCSENWECSAWSTCVEGKQRRTCNDLNLCGTNVRDKEQSCVVEKAAPEMTETDWKAIALGITGKVTSVAKTFSTDYHAEIQKQPVLVLPIFGFIGLITYGLYNLSLVLIKLYR